MYRVNFYDNDGDLMCWYSTDNKNEAYALAKKSKLWYAEVKRVREESLV